MPTTYSLEEILTFAVKIEEQGAAFYEHMAAKTKNTEVKELYTFLKNEELAHKKTYAALLSSLLKEPSVNYSDEYSSYMRALVETAVFRKDSHALNSDAEVLEYAIDREKDSILFYIEIKDHIPEKHHEAIDTIIDEERTHIIKLLDIKEKVG